jgi:hypothetical protein
MEPIQVYIGFDTREVVAYHVLVNSIIRHASGPVSFTPVALAHLGSVFSRSMDPKQATEFSFSRFLVPYLSGYRGWSMFLDCDMLFLDDIYALWEQRDDRYAAMVVKHDYVPKSGTKMFNQVQTRYPKKNWSSLMLFNGPRCHALTPEYVNTASGLELHQFKWLESEAMIGDLAIGWNYLVGEYEFSRDVKNLHFTLGGPYIKGFEGCDYAEVWFEEFERAFSCNGSPTVTGRRHSDR